jgi:hypothetical protein
MKMPIHACDGEFTLPVGRHPDKATRDVTAPPRYLDQPGPQVVRDGRAPEAPATHRRV